MTPAAAVPELCPDPAYTAGAPVRPRPIVVLGAGGIVRDAHLPAYRGHSLPVASLTDLDRRRADALAHEYEIADVYGSVSAAVAAAPPEAVYDVALPPSAHLAVLDQLPDGAAVLLQKPLGRTLVEGREIVALCRRKGLVAAMNTQLRFAPYVASARSLIASGALGELYDMQVRVGVRTPWELFPYTHAMDRLEITMHSVHYADLVRSFVGDPDGVSATTVGHPSSSLSNTRTELIMHYPRRRLRAVISTNHDHRFGPRHEESYIQWEGTRGAVRAQMGLLLDYPAGGSDALECRLDDEPGSDWRPLEFTGTWFPDAFAGAMSCLQRFAEGSSPTLPTAVEDVLRTTAVVEAAYRSSASGGVAPEYSS